QVEFDQHQFADDHVFPGPAGRDESKGGTMFGAIDVLGVEQDIGVDRAYGRARSVGSLASSRQSSAGA
ncbi:MAG: hypothetical protein JZU52_22180, partial [Lamprocystis purpurea]|nr:hypothetical protein [Lamprocystis purpurea]